MPLSTGFTLALPLGRPRAVRRGRGPDDVQRRLCHPLDAAPGASMIPMSEVELLLNQHMASPGGAPEPTPDWARLRGYQVISETRRPWRTGRIWRLGEKELVARKYFPP